MLGDARCSSDCGGAWEGSGAPKDPHAHGAGPDLGSSPGVTLDHLEGVARFLLFHRLYSELSYLAGTRQGLLAPHYLPFILSSAL